VLYHRYGERNGDIGGYYPQTEGLKVYGRELKKCWGYFRERGNRHFIF